MRRLNLQLLGLLAAAEATAACPWGPARRLGAWRRQYSTAQQRPYQQRETTGSSAPAAAAAGNRRNIPEFAQKAERRGPAATAAAVPSRISSGAFRPPTPAPGEAAAPSARDGEAAADGPPPLKRTPRSVLDRLQRNVVYQEAPSHVTSRTWVPPEPAPNQRSLTVSIVGAPNAGKSTLLNKLLGRKVSAVSPKYNTTRDRVLGILTRGNTQLVFTDTPGFVPATGAGSMRYVKTLVTAARDSVPESDIVLLVVDAARRFDEECRGTMRELCALCSEHGVHLFVVANKVDLFRGSRLSEAATRLLKPASAEEAAGAMRSGADTWGGGGALAGAPEEDSPWGRRRDRDALGRRVLDAKLDLILDAFEGAAFGAELISFRGFDEPSPAATSATAAAASTAGAAVRAAEPFGPEGEEGGLSSGEGPAASSPQSPSAEPSVYRFLSPVFPLSASEGTGVCSLLESLTRLALPRPWEYGASMVTDLSPLEQVEEVVREKLFKYLHREVPYGLRQVNRSWREAHPRPPSSDPLLGEDRDLLLTLGAGGDGAAAGPPELYVDQDIVVPSRRVASMLTSRSGGAIKAVTREAIADLTHAMQRRVHLFLHIKVGRGAGGEGAALGGGASADAAASRRGR